MVTKSTSIITTVARDGLANHRCDGGLVVLARLKYPRGVAVDASGNIYIVDTYNNCIRMVTKSTGIITTVAGYGTAGYSGDGGEAKPIASHSLNTISIPKPTPSSNTVSTLNPIPSPNTVSTPSPSVASTPYSSVASFVTSASPGKHFRSIYPLSIPQPAMRLKCSAESFTLMVAADKHN
jgi:NHL repeat